MVEPNVSPNRESLRADVRSWMTDVADRMGRLSPTDQADLRPRFTQIATDALKLVGNERDADLASQPPRTELYRAGIPAPDTERETGAMPMRGEDRDTLVKALAQAAGGIGVNAEDLQRRLACGAANALEERDWIRADVAAAAKTNGLNFDDPAERTQAARLVDRFYDTAAGLLAATHGRDVENPVDRLRRALTYMSKIAAEHGTVEFDSGRAARTFAKDMKARYGETVMADLARGNTDKLAADFADPAERAQIARAVVVVGAVHNELGLQRRETDRVRDTQTDPKEAAIQMGIEAEVRQLRSEGYSRAYISERSAEIEKAVVARVEKDVRARDRNQDRER